MKEDKKKERGEVSRRDFLIGAGAVVVGTSGLGLLTGCGGEPETVTITQTVSVPTTVTQTVAAETVTTTVGGVEPAFEQEESFVRNLSFSGASPLASSFGSFDVKDGKIVRIRPLHYDAKYSLEELKPWKLEARGKVFEPFMKEPLSPLSLTYKKRVYSPNRIRYPLKRVGWEPGGDPEKINPQNRGKSKFKRISWDEAATIVADELKRVQETYGPEAVMCTHGVHGQTRAVHGTHGVPIRLMTEGYTEQKGNPDSWEGWAWGAQHVWGMDCPATGEKSVGHMYPQTNITKDVAENTEMILCQGCDPETDTWGFDGQFQSLLCFWWTELGIKQVYICPDLNYGAAIHADKWIPVLPNTDAALHLAISYIWMTEGTYDKDYIATHTYGFDKYEDYVLGNEDGVAKTPQWASPLCGVPVWTIKALAREWASKVTSEMHVFGGPYIRGPYSHEPARLEVYNLAMQGLGKPGRWFIKCMADKVPGEVRTGVWAAWRGVSHGIGEITQFFWRPYTQQAILNPPIDNYGSAAFMPVKDQFTLYRYPLDGKSEIHMIWSEQGCDITCQNGTFGLIDAFRSPKIECIVAQQPWLENDLLYADLILPGNTVAEEDDIMVGSSGPFNIVCLEKKCIEPIGESMSDYRIVGEVAKKLGKYEELTEGREIGDWVRFGYQTSGVAEMISWDELNEKQYYVVPNAEGWEQRPVGISAFYEDPEKNPLNTKSGLIEFYAQWLAEAFPEDEERTPVAKWFTGGPGWTHDESLWGERCKQYPLLLVSNHPRWRMHAECDDVPWLREIPTCKVKGPDGYLYEPLWIHPADAEPRGIKSGDVVSIYNERGIVLGGAYVTEKIVPGAVQQYHGARHDPIAEGVDRGGANNMISPKNSTSKYCAGMAGSGFLVEVEKTDLAELREKYPEAFSRDYDQAAGLRFDAWIEGGLE